MSTTTGGSTFDDVNDNNFPITSSMDYSSQVDTADSYYNDGASSVTGQGHSYYHQDATEIVHEMYLALLYLLSNPDEFKKALATHPPRGATTLDEWNAELDDDTHEEESVMTSGTATTPLPFIVFADDAEVVLPQAHTASQLFGIEKVEGIELEAAAGIPALSQLFLRWLGKQKMLTFVLYCATTYHVLVLIRFFDFSPHARRRSFEYHRSTRAYSHEDCWRPIPSDCGTQSCVDVDE